MAGLTAAARALGRLMRGRWPARALLALALLELLALLALLPLPAPASH